MNFLQRVLGFFGLVDRGEQFLRCEYVCGTKEVPTRGGGMYMISYLLPGGDGTGTLQVCGNMPVGAMSAGKLRETMAVTPYYTRKIRKYLDSWGIDLVVLETLPAETIDLPTRAPHGWWESNKIQ